MTSGFSGERPALVLRHNIPCQCETWGNDTYAGASAWVLASRRFPAEELVAGHNIQCRSEILSLDICFQRGPGDNHDQQVLGRKTGAGTGS
ncbi:hypothetical protein BCT48_10935 [Vibrio sp. 10N.261.46.F12]|nr:hypothetical protein BCT48_10935 [Vibrio sp. 10N.261.46.F12]